MIKIFNNRYELKYLVHVTQRPALLEALAAHMLPDREGGPEGCYRVTSLYKTARSLLPRKLDGIKSAAAALAGLRDESRARRPAMIEINRSTAHGQQAGTRCARPAWHIARRHAAPRVPRDLEVLREIRPRALTDARAALIISYGAGR